MAGNYPYKIVRTGDQIETMRGHLHTIQYVLSGGQKVFECVVEKMDGAIVEINGRTHRIQRELIRKVHTVEKKKCPKKKLLTA